MKAPMIFMSSTERQRYPAGEISGALDQGQGRSGARARTVIVTAIPVCERAVSNRAPGFRFGTFGFQEG
jgi:hypothetical protein